MNTETETATAERVTTRDDGKAGELAIVVADRGHVWAGRVSHNGDEVLIEDARIIRRWGTSGKGLNYLATNGPQPSTVLDSPAFVRVQKRAVIYVIPCEEAAWKSSIA